MDMMKEAQKDAWSETLRGISMVAGTLTATQLEQPRGVRMDSLKEQSRGERMVGGKAMMMEPVRAEPMGLQTQLAC